MTTLTTFVGKIECTVIPAGRHEIGARKPDRFAGTAEGPLHGVTLSEPIGIACDPVTERQYAPFVTGHVSELTDLPVVEVSWTDAEAFCTWFAAETRRPWRLPSEAEWEVACRAGTETPFSTGHVLSPNEANFFDGEAGERIGPGRRTMVGSYPANAWGLRDMHGNVCEWCADAWHPSYEGAAPDGSPRAGAPDACRVIRGGAWDLLPRLLRSSWRDGLSPHTRRDNLGFRLALTLA